MSYLKVQKRSVFFLLMVSLLMIAADWVVFELASGVVAERSSGQMPHDVYIWQRRWDERLSRAIDTAASDVNSFSVLVAEVSWSGARPNVIRVPVDHKVLKSAVKPVSLALRIGPYKGKFAEDDKTAVFLSRLAASLVSESQEQGLKPYELQVDFDCAESKLDGYRKWVKTIHREIYPVKLTITALPCWLDKKEFASLANATDGYILQVHSLEKPENFNSEIVLCDAKAARKWVESASRLSVPFRVALPTYGYTVAFDRNGEFLGLSAEGPPVAWKRGIKLRVVNSDPFVIAKLVDNWQNDRPGNLTGVIWYRLPIKGDSLNWGWSTLNAVMEGREPQTRIGVNVEYPEQGLAELVLVNDGETNVSAEMGLLVEFEGNEMIACDGLRGFEFVREGGGNVILRYSPVRGFETIRAGERWKIGWIRFSRDMEAKISVCAIEAL